MHFSQLILLFFWYVLLSVTARLLDIPCTNALGAHDRRTVLRFVCWQHGHHSAGGAGEVEEQGYVEV